MWNHTVPFMSQSSHTHPTSEPPIRVLIVDDMSQVREDLRVLLHLSGEIEVVGEASNGAESIHMAELLFPDVVIMDLEMPIMDGIQATRHIKLHRLAHRVVILSVHSEPADIERAMLAGADAFVLKGSSYPALIEAIHQNRIQGDKK